MKIYCGKCKKVFTADAPTDGNQVACPNCKEMVDFPAGPTAPGAVVGDFLIERELSRGGMGEVYLARQLSLDRPVALKVLQPKFTNDKEYVDSLVHEARAAGRLSHPNIVQAYAVGEENGIFYFAMEFIRGETMKQVLKREKVIEFGRAAEIIKEIASALDCAWREQKLVHQDIKPDNIMIDANGFAKLADLGLARVAGTGDEHEAEEGDEVLGTPQYISPEQLTGVPTDVRSDIYSLGATFYQFVTGRFPYVADTAEELAHMHVDGNLTPPREVNPKVPEELNRIIMKMMARNIEDRYQTPAPLIKALEMFLRNYRPAGAAVPQLNFKLPKAGGGVPSFNLPKAGAAAAPSFNLPKAGAVPPPVSGPVSFAPPPPKHEPEPEAEPVQGQEEPQEEPQAPAAEPVLKPVGESVASEPESAPEPEPVSEEAAESGEEKKTAKRRFHPSRGMVITLIVIAVLIVILGGAGAALYFLQKSEKLPEAIRPVGEVVVSTVDGWFAAAPAEPVAPQKKAAPVRPATPQPPPGPVTRKAYLSEIKRILSFARSNPKDRAKLLIEADRFFARYPVPVTQEERNAVQPLLAVYAPADEEERVAPAREELRKAHRKAVQARREEQERLRAEAERQRIAERERQAEQEAEQKRLREEAVRIQEAQKKRIAQLRQDLGAFYPDMASGFFEAGLKGDFAPLDAAVGRARNFIAPVESVTPEEVKMLQEFQQFRDMLPVEAKAFRAFVEEAGKFGPEKSFYVDHPRRRNTPIRLASIKPDQFQALTGSGEHEDLNLNSPQLRRTLLRLQNAPYNWKNVLFNLDLMYANFTPNTVRSLPAGFWKSNYSKFLTAYFESRLRKADGDEKKTLEARYGKLPEFQAAVRAGE